MRANGRRCVVRISTMTYREIRLDLQSPIAELTLARADTRNAMTVVMGDEVSHAVGELNAARHVRALIVRGDGKGFSSGGDFNMLEERARATEGENRVAMRKFYESFLSIRAVRVPTIAVLHGAAMGAGLCFALACNLRLAATGTKLGANFVRVGLHPGMGATWLLPPTLRPRTRERAALHRREPRCRRSSSHWPNQSSLPRRHRSTARLATWPSGSPKGPLSQWHRPKPRSRALAKASSMRRSIARPARKPSTLRRPI